ncbi:MAG: rhodanese-like domain-containing protein [Lachnospiraceae bacterium]|nr:rhodanese-like domain-containing protein [Lachnospiraceae bacterium]
MDTIPAKELDWYVGRPGYLIVDLRSSTEFFRGHIRGAISVPEESMDCLREELKKEELILYCDRGSRSMSVARDLEKKGWRTKTVVGGIKAYRGENMVGE